MLMHLMHRSHSSQLAMSTSFIGASCSNNSHRSSSRASNRNQATVVSVPIALAMHLVYNLNPSSNHNWVCNLIRIRACLLAREQCSHLTWQLPLRRSHYQLNRLPKDINWHHQSSSNHSSNSSNLTWSQSRIQAILDIILFLLHSNILSRLCNPALATKRTLKSHLLVLLQRQNQRQQQQLQEHKEYPSHQS